MKKNNKEKYDIETIGKDFLIEVIQDIIDKRSYFCSEADFQFELAWNLKEKLNNPDIEIKLEYYMNIDSEDMHIDILIIQSNRILPIELKYKTKAFDIKNNNKVIYTFKNHSAYAANSYLYLKDIERIEKIRNNNKDNFVNGFAIMLTNDGYYKKEPKESSCHYNFSLYNGRTLDKASELKWKNPSNNNSKWFEKSPVYNKPLKISSLNEINWEKDIKVSKYSDSYSLYLLITQIEN